MAVAVRGVAPAGCALLLVLLSLTCCGEDRVDVRVVCIGGEADEGAFRLEQTAIDVPCVDFEGALYRDTRGYPRLDFGTFDREKAGTITRRYEAVVLENAYVKLTLLPAMGKPYSFVYKVTGHEEFFLPTVAQPLGSPNDLGWWFALGGVEYTLPDDEHGDTWAADWTWEIVEDSSTCKTVRMRVEELRLGLVETIDISLYPDKAGYEALLSITNPTDDAIRFQHWINPMWAPGGRGEITVHTEFVMPTRQVHVTERKFNDWMLEYDPQGSRTQAYDDSPLRFLSGWKSTGDLLACELEHGFYSAFSHEEDEGVVRVFPRDATPGCNIWAWGAAPGPATRKRFSGSESCRGYVEMWGGVTHGFDEYRRLEPGEGISWVEWMYPYHGTKGLHFANRDLAITFTRRPDGEHTVRFCPSGDLTGIECRVVSAQSGETRLRIVCESLRPVKDLPEFSIDAAGEDLLLLILDDGEEVARLPARGPPRFPE